MSDLKSVYRVLSRHLTEHMELLDNEFFVSLQRTLRSQASEEGVDVRDASAWEAWLNQHYEVVPPIKSQWSEN